jgi:hypothetical protein
MRTFASSLLVVLAVAPAARAQYGYGYGGYGGGYSSTVEEGAQRGFADVVRSAGMANLMNSEAAKNYEDARKKYLENRMQATQTYFDMRRYNQQARAAERGTPLSTEQYVRLARQQAPDRLSVSQLDPLSGLISWPPSLRRDAYATDRAALEAMFKQRAAGTAGNYDEIRSACDALQDKLKANISTFMANDFIAAKKFVESLSYELSAPQR